jgi:hypothetical protein
MGIVAPLVEASIGVGLLTRYRNWAVILALGMHAFILLCLGPLGHDWNTVVWPWNVAMATFVVLLFWRTGDISPKKILLPTRRRPSYLHAVVLVLFAVMPLFGLFGLWDSCLSASLYSGNNERGGAVRQRDRKGPVTGGDPRTRRRCPSRREVRLEPLPMVVRGTERTAVPGGQGFQKRRQARLLLRRGTLRGPARDTG